MSEDTCVHLQMAMKNDATWSKAMEELLDADGRWRSPIGYFSSWVAIPWCRKRRKVCRWLHAFFSMTECKDYDRLPKVRNSLKEAEVADG